MFVAANFRNKLSKWIDIGANAQVIEWIEHGVSIPWQDQPSDFELENKHFSTKESQFIDREISDLICSGAIRKCETKPKCVSPIGCVPKKHNKFRLITDLRRVNDHTQKISFQYENIDTVLQLVEPQDYLVTLDIKNGFQHVPVSEADQTYLGFKWRGQYYCWQVLPFGLSLSPYFFHKCVREAVRHLRSLHLRTSAYVDDFILGSAHVTIERNKDILMQELDELGFMLNTDKSSLVPETEKEHIGFVISTALETDAVWIKIPPKRIRKLRHDIDRLLRRDIVTARQLARVAGQCVAMSKAVVPAKLLLRDIYKLLKTRTDWDTKIYLSEEARRELVWWRSALNSWNGAAAPRRTIDTQLVTDASATAWGGHCQGKEAQGFWNPRISGMSSNYRELMAILLSMMSLLPNLQGKSVQVLCDNVVAVAYVNFQGGPSKPLTSLAKAIWSLALENRIQIVAKHLSGSSNTWADSLSRLPPVYEWKLHPRLWRLLDTLWGPHTVDRFGSLLTTQLPRYNSRFWDPMTEGVDAFAQDWSQDNNYANPPFRLIHRVLDTIQEQKACATVIAPWWPSQPWFQKIQRMAVAPPVLLPRQRMCCLRMGPQIEPGRNRRWRIYAWRVCGMTD